MKGQFMLVVISLLVVSIVIIAAFSPLTQDYEATARTAAKSYATEIAGAINAMQTSPAGTRYTYTNMPDKECEIRVEKLVTVILDPETERQYGISGLISGIEVEPAIINCDETTKISIEREADKITVRGLV